MLEPTSDYEVTSFVGPSALDAEWRRCRREARSLTLLELAETSLALGILIVVALCGIVAITHDAVATGELGLPLALGLAVTVALSILGFAFRLRMSRERLAEEIFRLNCARRTAAEIARRKREPHPYRQSGAPSTTCCGFTYGRD
jgi:hypothetical protein